MGNSISIVLSASPSYPPHASADARYIDAAIVSKARVGWHAFYECGMLASITIPSSIGHGVFAKCSSLKVLMVQPAGGDAAAATAIVEATNDELVQAQIWATDDVIAKLAGPFDAYACFAEVPREMRAAPDATTWAGVQLWQWWSSPDVDVADNRAISNPRLAALWTVLHAACRAAEEEALPELEPELWLLIFTFIKRRS